MNASTCAGPVSAARRLSRSACSAAWPQLRGRDRAAEHGALEIVLVVLGEGGAFGDVAFHLLSGARFEALEAFVYVDRVPRLGHLPVGDDVEPAFGLLAHHRGHALANQGRIGVLVDRSRVEPALHHVEQRPRPRQTADVRGQDPIRAVLHALVPR